MTNVEMDPAVEDGINPADEGEDQVMPATHEGETDASGNLGANNPGQGSLGEGAAGITLGDGATTPAFGSGGFGGGSGVGSAASSALGAGGMSGGGAGLMNTPGETNEAAAQVGGGGGAAG